MIFETESREAALCFEEKRLVVGGFFLCAYLDIREIFFRVCTPSVNNRFQYIEFAYSYLVIPMAGSLLRYLTGLLLSRYQALQCLFLTQKPG